MGSDAKVAASMAAYIKFQSALPHGERPLDVRLGVVKLLVSIRAPAWGATADVVCIPWIEVVSIRAPAWGATTDTGFDLTLVKFQSALPHGERLLFGDEAITRLTVSIRAPAWGATLARRPALVLRTGFNPRSRMGSDR